MRPSVFDVLRVRVIVPIQIIHANVFAHLRKMKNVVLQDFQYEQANFFIFLSIVWQLIIFQMRFRSRAQVIIILHKSTLI